MSLAEEIYDTVLSRIDLSDQVSDDRLMELIHRVIREKAKDKYIPFEQRAELGKTLFHSFRKLGLLEELIEDPEITEIMVNGKDHIFVERKGTISPVDKRFTSGKKLEDVAQLIASGSNRIVNESSPIVDARLTDGSRVNIVMPPIALNGPIITIRKCPGEPISMADLIRMKSISGEAADFLRKLVKSGYNIFISGGTGSGKTTFLNALSEYIPREERIITIEDNAELRLLDKPNLVQLEARNANTEGTGEVSIRQLIKTALRMRPDRIIVGEVRGEEAIDMISAFNTGHDGSLSTGHANSTEDMINRLSTMILMGMELPLEAIYRMIVSGIDIMVHLGRSRDGFRRVIAISELEAYERGRVILNPLFELKEGELRKIGTLKNCTKIND